VNPEVIEIVGKLHMRTKLVNMIVIIILSHSIGTKLSLVVIGLCRENKGLEFVNGSTTVPYLRSPSTGRFF
jgi:hypothetical protein